MSFASSPPSNMTAQGITAPAIHATTRATSYAATHAATAGVIGTLTAPQDRHFRLSHFRLKRRLLPLLASLLLMLVSAAPLYAEAQTAIPAMDWATRPLFSPSQPAFLGQRSPQNTGRLRFPAESEEFKQQVKAQHARLTPHQQRIQRHLLRQRHTIEMIYRELDKRQLPRQLVLLPMLESTFNPLAVSPAKAAGLWQLMPATAKRFGLSVTPERDDRFDVSHSTQAALDYLTFLYRKFHQDLNLTLAAYNAGEGRVSRAQSSDKQRFSQLRLPAETVNYVHKFHALLQLVDVAELATHRPYSSHPIAGLLAPQRSTVDANETRNADETQYAEETQDTQILTTLFAKRTVINMKPISPLIPVISPDA